MEQKPNSDVNQWANSVANLLTKNKKIKKYIHANTPSS